MLNLIFAAAFIAAAASPSPAPAQRIEAARSRLTVGAALGGPGAVELTQAARDARFVMLGEDHGTREIARLADAMDAMLQPLGYDTVAVEMGPLAAAKLQSLVTNENPAKAVATFENTYPATIAFYTWADELTFLQHAAQRSDSHFTLWGLDQELMGSPGFILTSILAEHPGPQSTALVRRMLQSNARDWAKASETGAPPDMYLLHAPETDFTALAASLKRDGNLKAQSMAQSLLDTYRIYINCCNGNGRISNRDRALLMKQTYLKDATASGNKNRRVFFKFGGEHLYRGMNPLNNNDLGNFITERADGLGLKDVHVLALGISGKQSAFAGINKPWANASYALMDSDHAEFHFLKPFIDEAYPDGYTLYDLRPFRSHFKSMGIDDIGFYQVVYGYDFLVLIQNTTADPAIAPNVF